jgi:hydroxymethylbilane synthase
MSKPIRIGTRGSDLALWQANHIKWKLQELGLEVSISIIKTQGDRVQDLSFSKMEGKGFFTKEIEHALLDNSIDLAVHSHKDLETTNAHGLTIAAVTQRADVRDVLLSKEALSDNREWKGLRIGTSSARRKALVADLFPGSDTIDLRGNVPTRVAKLEGGEYDAIVLAAAGLDRLELDLAHLHLIRLDPTVFVPAPAQGALALQIRVGDIELSQKLGALSHTETEECVRVERELLRSLEGGCQLPFGAFCSKVDTALRLHVAWVPKNSERLERASFTGNTSSEVIDQAKKWLSRA